MAGNQIPWSRRAALLVAACHLGALTWLACAESPTWQEPAQLAAGLSWWSFGRSDTVRVSGPLLPSVAALPVLPFGPVVDCDHFDRPPEGRDEHARAARLVTDNSHRARQYFLLARLACLPLSLLGAYCCWHLANRLFGAPSALMALTLWCFCPYVVGHAAVNTTDAHAAAIGLTATACYWCWLRSPDWLRAVVAGISLGFAVLSKLTLLLLCPLLPACWVVYRLSERKGTSPRAWLRQGGILAAVLLISVHVINCGYLLEGTFTPLGEFRFQTTTLSGCPRIADVPPEGGNRFAGTWLGRMPVPADMVQGIDTQRYDFERGMRSYLGGEWADRGWWYYYLYALAIKVPLGTWCLVGLALGVTLFGRGYSAAWRDEMVVLAPGLAILIFVSSQTGFSVHSRYVIPALPFFFVWASKVGRVFEMRPVTGKRQVLAAAVVMALAWSVASSLWVYPHSLSYFNELVGGPKHGGEHLLDSNIDWGQDLFYLKDWLEDHPEVKLDGLACFGSYPVTLVGIPETPHPPRGAEIMRGDPSAVEAELGPKPGWYALSVNYLYGRSRQFRYFLRFEPVASAGYSIYVYHVTLDEADRVRREMGLPEIRGSKAEVR